MRFLKEISKILVIIGIYSAILLFISKYQVYFNEFNNNYEVHLDILGQDLVYVVDDMQFIN